MSERVRRRQPKVSTEEALLQIALYKDLGIHPREIRPAGTALAEAPYIATYRQKTSKEVARLVELARNPETPREEFLDSITNPSLPYVTTNYIAFRYGAFLSSADTVRLCGLYMGPSQSEPARDALQESGLTIRYNDPSLAYPVDYLPRRDLGAAYTLLDTPVFEPYRNNPISRIGPQVDPEPSTTDFVRPKDFIFLGRLLHSFGLATRGYVLKVEPESFFGVPENPAPIYLYDTRTIYHRSHEEALKGFITHRKQQLGV